MVPARAPPRRAPLRMSPLHTPDTATAPPPGGDEADSRNAGARGSAEDGAQYREGSGGHGGLDQVTDDKGHEALGQALRKRHVRKRDHPGQAEDVHGEEGHERGRRHREDATVGAALGGQTRDRGDEEVAEDVAEGREGPADVRAGEDRGARNAEEGVRRDGDEASARTEGRTDRESTKRAERDGHRREGQRDRDTGQHDHGDRTRGDQGDLANDRAAEAVGEDAVLARGDGGSGQGGHTAPFNRANSLSFNN